MNIMIILPILVVGVGFYLLIKTRFFFILHPKRTVRTVFFALKKPSSRRCFWLALAGTLGVGNIFGVAAGIMIGGAGSVFWLLVSALFSMIIKYAEALLSFDSLTEKTAGMHRVIECVFSKAGKPLAGLYCAFCLLLSLFMGASMQGAAVAQAAQSSLGIDFGLCLAVFSALVILGALWGDGIIEKITSYTIPLTTIIYILMSFLVIFINFGSLPQVLSSIVSSAFAPRALGGGALSFFFSRAFYEGFARGTLSNEAGCGTSSFAHTRASEGTPKEAGLFGMCEVFFDTVVICPLTALVILLSGGAADIYESPMELVYSAFVSSLGEWSGILLLLSVFTFAYSTVICWFSYGSECTEYLFQKRTPVFIPAFAVFLIFGAQIKASVLITLTDAVILILSLITLTAIIKKSGRIWELTKE